VVTVQRILTLSLLALLAAMLSPAPTHADKDCSDFSSGHTSDGVTRIGNIFIGTSDSDTIIGTDGDDIINAGGDDDFICGRGGNDIINAGDGDDTVFGGDGNDIMNGGPGDDLLRGEDGHDIINGDGNDDCSGGSDDDIVNC
jgi:Ca2+-binding RTX toxin-like protein